MAVISVNIIKKHRLLVLGWLLSGEELSTECIFGKTCESGYFLCPFSHTPPAFAAFTIGMLEDSVFCKAFQENM